MSALHAGHYNEVAFKALDYIIYRAGRYGIRLILTFGDEWNLADSKTNYLTWGNATDNTNLFFTDRTIQQYYKDHIRTIVNRNVSFTVQWEVCTVQCLAAVSCHCCVARSVHVICVEQVSWSVCKVHVKNFDQANALSGYL